MWLHSDELRTFAIPWELPENSRPLDLLIWTAIEIYWVWFVTGTNEEFNWGRSFEKKKFDNFCNSFNNNESSLYDDCFTLSGFQLVKYMIHHVICQWNFFCGYLINFFPLWSEGPQIPPCIYRKFFEVQTNAENFKHSF